MNADSKQLHLKIPILPEGFLTCPIYIRDFTLLECSCLWLAEPALAVYITARCTLMQCNFLGNFK